MPEIEAQETSVFRHGAQPPEELWTIGRDLAANGRTIRGAAIIKAGAVRSLLLDVFADEPPLRHAAIRKWPQDNDPELQKGKHKELAVAIASLATLLRP